MVDPVLGDVEGVRPAGARGIYQKTKAGDRRSAFRGRTLALGTALVSEPERPPRPERKKKSEPPPELPPFDVNIRDENTYSRNQSCAGQNMNETRVNTGSNRWPRPRK